jgi:hypothetical protein
MPLLKKSSALGRAGMGEISDGSGPAQHWPLGSTVVAMPRVSRVTPVSADGGRKLEWS